jgi:hypothetical protein
MRGAGSTARAAHHCVPRGFAMDVGQAIKTGFSNYVKFTGRASRSEFWY